MIEEENDILEARTSALDDSNDAFDDLEWRLEDLRDDIFTGFDIEEEKIQNALSRAAVERKNPVKVLYALKIDWLSEINADPANLGGAPTQDTSAIDFNKYDTIFDDFHYDIGHGKGIGEGDVDTAPVYDGPYTQAPGPRGPVGDYEVDVGAQTHAW